MAGRRQAFQNNPELQRFVLPRVRPTGRQLGVGSYGSVEELEVNGVVCAGKRLHEVLLEQGNAGMAEISRKYLLECQVMAEMRHPHIVQFLGLCFLEGSTMPVLVMEQLDRSLDDLLETSPCLPLTLKLSLLTDVARGLLYLHTHNPPVVHRDLSARNVLLSSSMVAKISDLGNARIVNLQPGQLARTLTRVPGTHVYMPPESFDEHSRYGPRLDIFSFGHLALFTLTQVFPDTLLPHTYPDPDNPDHVLGRTEVERRTNYIQPLSEQLREQHTLLQLVCQCLHNTPAQRPSAEELLQQLQAVRPQIKRAHGRQQVVVEMARLQVAMMGVLETDNEIERLEHDLQQEQEERERLQLEMEAKNTQLQQKDAQLQQKDTQLQHKDGQIQQQGTELQERALQLNRQQRELQTLREDKERLQAEVDAKDAEIDRQQRCFHTMRSKISHLQQHNQDKDAEVHRQHRELQVLRAEMDARSVQVQQQLGERDAEINRLQRELREQTASRYEHVARMQSPPLKSVAAIQSPHQKSQTHPLSELTWRRLPNMPRAMLHPQSVAVEGILYVNERRGYYNNSGDIHRCDLHTQQWLEPINYQYRWCGMTTVSSQLVMLGGRDVSSHKTTKTVAVYDPSLMSWKQPYPPMNTPRIYPAASTYHQRLVVAGGRESLFGGDLATVEVLDTSVNHSQWLFATPLPVRCRLMSAAIIHGTLYLLGGSLGKQVLSVSLPALTQTDKPPAEWCTLPDVPLEYSAAIAGHGSLLAVGGSHGGRRSSTIHVYDQDAWNKLGDLPTERAYCACCLLPSGEVLVAGGDSSRRRMDVAAVKD